MIRSRFRPEARLSPTTNNTVVNTTDYRNVGIILLVVPRINVNGNVIFDVEQEISNILNNASANTPTLTQQHVKTSVMVARGQTVLLAGLITENRETDRPGIPGLEQIPLVGNAFAHTNNTTARTELIIFIRPQIIRDSFDAHFIAEELRSKLRGSPESSASPNDPRSAHAMTTLAFWACPHLQDLRTAICRDWL